MVCRTDLGLPGLPGFFVLPGPLRKVENVLHTYTVLDFIGESPYTRRVTGVSPCFEGEFRDSDGICGKVGHGRDDVKGKVWGGCWDVALSPSRRLRFLVDISPPLRHTHRMIIRCLRTDAVLEKDLTITTAGEAMVRRIRAAAADWLPENIEAVVDKYQRTGWHPFMFDVFANETTRRLGGDATRRR